MDKYVKRKAREQKTGLIYTEANLSPGLPTYCTYYLIDNRTTTTIIYNYVTCFKSSLLIVDTLVITISSFCIPNS